jgi:hypothetical protein
MNELCEYTTNLIHERYNETPEIIYNKSTGFFIKWDGNNLLVNYQSIDSVESVIRIGFYNNHQIRTIAAVNNLLEAYRYITLLINRISPYKLQ